MAEYYPIPITALAQSDDDGTNGSNIVAGAVITVQDLDGNTVIMYDDDAGSGAATSKTTSATGQRDIYVTPGDYNVYVNGINPKRYSAGGKSALEVDTFANLELLRPVKTGQSFICQERANARYILQASGYVALPGDVTFANGRVGKLQLSGGGSVYVEWFGAVGDRSTDDTASIQSAIDRVTANNGGIVYVFGRYRTTSTITLNGESVSIKGCFPQRVFTNAPSSLDNGQIYADFTSGPAILVADGGCKVTDLSVFGSATRRAATITTGAQKCNSGIVVEPEDTSTDIIQSVSIENVFVNGHPADGLLSQGDVTNISIKNFYASDIGRHGIAIDGGSISGRTNFANPGIIYIEKGKSFDCGGHGIAIGTDTSSAYPYRVTIINREGYRNASDPSLRYSTANNFIVGQDVTTINCAWGGSGTGNLPDHEGIEVGGRNVSILNSRFVACQNNYVIIRQQPGFSTYNLTIDGGTCTTTGGTPPADFALLSGGANGVTIKGVRNDGANRITEMSVSSTNDNIVLHDIDVNKTVHYNHEYDFSESGLIKNNNGGELTISSASVTITYEGFYTIDTEGDAASDNLASIIGGSTGDVIVLRQNNSGRVVTLTDGSGNIRLSGSVSYSFPNTASYITLMKDGSNWNEISRSEN